jgi:hypothetical protein
VRVVTVSQPWAGLIVAGRSPVANRRAAVKYRGPLAIHAAATRRSRLQHCAECQDCQWCQECEGCQTHQRRQVCQHCQDWQLCQHPGDCDVCQRLTQWDQHVIGVVELIDCIRLEAVPESALAWASGPWCWLLAHPRRIAPLPMPARAGCWTVPERGLKYL